MTESRPDDDRPSLDEPEWVETPTAPPTVQGEIVMPTYEPQPTDLGVRMLIPVGRSPLALIAGYLGLMSLVVIPGPLALFFGILAVMHIRRSTNVHGMGRAIFAIVMGGVATIVLVIGVLAIILDDGR